MSQMSADGCGSGDPLPQPNARCREADRMTILLVRKTRYDTFAMQRTDAESAEAPRDSRASGRGGIQSRKHEGTEARKKAQSGQSEPPACTSPRVFALSCFRDSIRQCARCARGFRVRSREPLPYGRGSERHGRGPVTCRSAKRLRALCANSALSAVRLLQTTTTTDAARVRRSPRSSPCPSRSGCRRGRSLR